MRFVGAYGGFQTVKNEILARVCCPTLTSVGQRMKYLGEILTYRSVAQNIRKINVGEQSKEVQ